MKIPHPSIIVITLELLSLSTAARAATTILNETFSAAERTGWYASGAASTISYAPGALTLTALNAGASKHVVTYFESTTLGVGDTLTLNLTFSVSGITGSSISGVSGASDQFRLGVFGSGANGQVNKDGHGASGSTGNGLDGGFGSYTGYSAAAAFASGGGLSLRERGAINNQLLTSADAFTSFTSANNGLTSDYVSGTLLTSGQTYTLTYSLEYASADRMITTLTLSGVNSAGTSFSYTITGEDRSGIVSTFDTLALSVNNSAVDFTVTGASIVHAPIPEPASAMFGSLAALLAIVASGRPARRPAP